MIKGLDSAFRAVAVLCAFFALEGMARAARGYMSSSEYGSSGESRSIGRQNMLADVTLQYVRDTKADGATEPAGKFSLGGMFNNWLGLDFQGFYGIKSNSYLVGSDFRLVPTEWLFMRGGIGGYAQKETGTFKATPIAGAGILAHFERDFYFVTEMSYFQIADRNNVSFGAGLGIIF